MTQTNPPPATESPARAFWQQYIALHPGFGKFLPEFHTALDSIASTPEGQELIAKASRNVRLQSGDDARLLHIGPVIPPKQITSLHPLFEAENIATLPGTWDLQEPWGTGGFPVQGKGSFSSAIHGRIGIDLNEVRRMVIDTRDGKKPLGLTGVLVHELFHSADPNRLPDVMEFRKEQAITTINTHLFSAIICPQTTSGEQKEALFNAAMQASIEFAEHSRKHYENKEFGASLSPQTEASLKALDDYNHFLSDPEATARFLRRQGLDASKFNLRPLSPEALREVKRTLVEQNQREIAYLPGHRIVIPVYETDATRFADAYMRKYHGSYLRNEYKNGKEGTQDHGVYAVTFQCAKKNLPTYAGETVETREGQKLDQPSVQATPTCPEVMESLRRR